MGYQDKCANGIQDMMAHMTLMSATVEEIHGGGFGMINGKKSATLVELLVVISIIGILSGMLLTSVAKAKKSAQRVECLNYQRQLYIYYYADNWDDDRYEDHPSYTTKELMDTYPLIKQTCFDCHSSTLTTVQ